MDFLDEIKNELKEGEDIREAVDRVVLLQTAIQTAWYHYQKIQNDYRKLTGKEYQWLK